MISPLDQALRMVASGEMRIDLESGIVHQTFVTKLYSYERPVGLLHSNGYVAISMGSRRQVYAHRLICSVLHGHIPDGMVINHIDGVKHHNQATNLEVVTPSANSIHAYSMGLSRGARKLSDPQVADVRLALTAGARVADIAVQHGVSAALIHQVKGGQGRFANV